MSFPEIQFSNLADFHYNPNKKLNKISILLLADDRHIANVVKDHIQAFSTHSIHEIIIENPIHKECNSKHWANRFDVILIHYSIFVLGEYFLPLPWQKAIARFKGLKVQIIQDEYRSINAMKTRMVELGISIVFSSLEPETAEKVYGGEQLNHVSFFSCLPGYVADNYMKLSPPPISGRPLHIVYRGRTLPACLGRIAQEKRVIGEQIRRAAETFNLRVDISSEEKSRIYGDEWTSFLMKGRATLGVEGGASIFDFDESVSMAAAEYLEKYPDADFEQIWSEVLQSYEGNIEHKTLTPKIFEAIASKTALILYPGKYRGILEPDRHYIPLARDGSNIPEIMSMLCDTDALQALVDRTHEEVLGRKDLTMQFYISKIDRILSFQIRNTLRRFFRNFSNILWRHECN